MIGGYAQLSYGFNYYGTIRDQPRRVRRRAQDEQGDWLDTPARNRPEPKRSL